MKKQLILSSILLSPLLLNIGCTEQNQPTINRTDAPLISSPPIKEEIDITLDDSPQIVPPSVTPYQPVLSEIHQMHSVQGDTISIQEHNRGLLFPDYPDRVVLIQVFGKECPYCFQEMPIINKIQDAYPEKVSVIAVQAQKPMSKERAFELIREHNMNYPVIDHDEAEKILIFLRDVYEWRGILPYIMLLKNGQIEHIYKGSDKSFEEISEGIDEIY
jgi:thiol-disulfide isomerase/thioredoxin